MPAEPIETTHTRNEYDLDRIYSCVRPTSAVQSLTAIVIILIRFHYTDVIRYEKSIFLLSSISTLFTMFIIIMIVFRSYSITRKFTLSNNFHRICCKCFYFISILNCIGSWFIVIIDKAIMQHLTYFCGLLAVTLIIYSFVCVLIINCNIQRPNIEKNLLLVAYICFIVGLGVVHYGIIAFLYQQDIFLSIFIIMSILLFLGEFHRISYLKTSKRTLYLWFNLVTLHLVTYSYGYHIKMQYYDKILNPYDQNLIPTTPTYDELLN